MNRPCRCSRHAVDVLVETLLATDEPITLVATGPLTNLALALAREPGIARDRADRVDGRGHARSRQHHPALNSTCAPIPMRPTWCCARACRSSCSGSTSRELLVTRARLARMKIGNPVARAAHDMLAFLRTLRSCQYGKDGAPLHDPCTMAWLLRPTSFRTRACHVAIETGSPLTLGHSVVDFWNVEAGRVLCNGPMKSMPTAFSIFCSNGWRVSASFRVP
jgi:purine nucleosidase